MANNQLGLFYVFFNGRFKRIRVNCNAMVCAVIDDASIVPTSLGLSLAENGLKECYVTRASLEGQVAVAVFMESLTMKGRG